MNTEMAREVVDLPAQFDQQANPFVLGIEPGLDNPFGGFLAAREVVVQFGELVDLLEGKTERLADIADSRAALVRDNLADHSGVFATVLFVNVLDRLLAPVVGDIDIDVGRFGALF